MRLWRQSLGEEINALSAARYPQILSMSTAVAKRVLVLAGENEAIYVKV
jgi:hypothetical protein